MFNLFAPTSIRTKAPRWAARTNQYPMVFGLSPFADLFVCSDNQELFAVITTERPELIELKFETMTDFTEQFLTNSAVRQSLFREADYVTLCSQLGPLNEEECFYAVPFRPLGGSGALETYQKGNAWVHLELYGQAVGL